MKVSGQKNLNLFFRCLYDMGIRHVFVSPGSRNAPLIIAASEAAPFSVVSVVDERSAAYKALGVSLATNLPSVLICTSGTATLNLFPAIAEAKYLHAKLLVLTADRPQYLVDSWENQTIPQKKVYGTFVNKYYEWKGRMETSPSYGSVIRLAQKSWDSLHFPDQGAVHINFHFSEPLYFPNAGLPDYEPFKTKIRSFTFPKNTTTLQEIHPKTLILCGAGSEDKETRNFLKDLQALGYPLLADLLSPYRDLCTNSQWEQSISEHQWEKQKPSMLITTGRFFLNKNLKLLLRKDPSIIHYHIADSNLVKNMFGTKMQIIRRSLSAETIAVKSPHEDFSKAWSNSFSAIKTNKQLLDILGAEPFSDFFAVVSCIEKIPSNSVLHLANSMSIRYAAWCSIDSSIKIFSNRGTSGIDGCISTAYGAAMANPTQTHFVICGDLAFFYDSNALWNSELVPNLKIIVLNNFGGNIFDMLPGPQSTKAIDLFTTPHQRNCAYICKDFGVDYFKAENKEDLSDLLPQFLNTKLACVLEIQSNSKINKQIWNQIKQTTQAKENG